ncbi:hypothetical protein [Actinacidiphila acidipaludis]|uniref:Uncharacterized protein n=1 Tax=Actinacidiphila acidipaludis TaxID=2873382 RepID=A0ABS7QHS5_9ACTN|nr:hypothetical protein [Streptomyces acidipaludis]MBY8882725.1 hypothetical protein [Streptomyces acidipaludis]
MPATNVPFEPDELDAINRAAQASGKSARQYIKDAALSAALGRQEAFLSAALTAGEHTREAFQLQFSETEEQRALRAAEAAAAREVHDEDEGRTAA